MIVLFGSIFNLPLDYIYILTDITSSQCEFLYCLLLTYNASGILESYYWMRQDDRTLQQTKHRSWNGSNDEIAQISLSKYTAFLYLMSRFKKSGQLSNNLRNSLRWFGSRASTKGGHNLIYSFTSRNHYDVWFRDIQQQLLL